MSTRSLITSVLICSTIFLAPEAAYPKASRANGSSLPIARSENDRRDKIWFLFENETPNDIRCNKMGRCNDLIDALLHRRGVTFIDPILRARASGASELIKRLGRCNSRDIGRFDISDGARYGHQAQGRGPVTVYETSLGQGDQSHRAYRIEYHKLRHPDLSGIPTNWRVDDPGLQGTTIVDLSTCEVADSGYENLSEAIDTGFFEFNSTIYRYIVGAHPNATNIKNNNYWIIIDGTAMNASRSGEGLIFYLPMHTQPK